MKFLLEKIDIKEVEQLYFLRGYENEENDNYCVSMVLVGDINNEFTIKLLTAKKTLTIKDGKDLLKYLKTSGMKCSAEVLKTDFDKFYDTRAFEKIKL